MARFAAWVFGLSEVLMPVLPIFGAACFGVVVGWMASRVHTDTKSVDTKWLTAMIAIIGGGAVTALFDPKSNSNLFGSYCVGLALTFLGRPIVLYIIDQFFKRNRESAVEEAVLGYLPRDPIKAMSLQQIQQALGGQYGEHDVARAVGRLNSASLILERRDDPSGFFKSEKA